MNLNVAELLDKYLDIIANKNLSKILLYVIKTI